MSLHRLHTLSRLPTKSLLLLRNTACLVEKKQLPIFIVLDITRPGLEPKKLEHAREHAKNYTTDAAKNASVSLSWLHFTTLMKS